MKKLIPKINNEENVYNGFLKITKASLSNDGGDFSRERLERPDAVAVLLINADTEEFIMVNQYRYPISNKHNGTIIELPAGIVGDHNENEDPIEAARRELEEEVGYRVDEFEGIYTYFPSVGYCSERVHLLLATVTNQDVVGDGGGVSGESEMLERVGIGIQEAYRMLDNGEIIDGKTIIALQALRSTWLAEDLNISHQQINDLEQKVRDLELKISLIENKPKEV